MSTKAGPHRDQVLRVVFRYDDCSAKSSLSLERDFLGVFAACGAQVSMGVIPFVCEGDFHDRGPQRFLPLPPDKAELLRETARAGHAEIALHGYTHQRSQAQYPSELAGLGAGEQLRRLREGKEE